MTDHLHGKHTKGVHTPHTDTQPSEKGGLKMAFSSIVTLLKHHKVLFLILLVLLGLGVWFLASFENKYANRFYPNVFLGGEAVGGQTYQEVSDHFKEKVARVEKEGLHVDFKSNHGMLQVVVPSTNIGLTSDASVEYFILDDWETYVQEAYSWGRGKNFVGNGLEQIALLFSRKNFNFSSNIQKDAIASLVENELDNFLSKSASASFVSKNNTVTIVKEKAGEFIDTEEVTTMLAKKLGVLDVTPLVVTAEPVVPTVLETDLSPRLEFVNSVAKELTIVLTYGTHTWKIPGITFVTWLTVNSSGDLGVDRLKLEKYLASKVASFIDNPPQNSRFEIQNGKLVEIVPGKDGNGIDVEELMQKIEKIIPEVGTRSIPITVMSVAPKVTKKTISEYEIEELVGEIRTSFTGSTADREHNIKIGVAAISGILIAPGAEFSTVGSIGRVTEDEGYVKEMVIKENTTTKEFGGGLCQVSTTLFRLALNAGLPISERMNHKFVVHYYDPPGLDATIYGPHPDFRFVNDTGHYLLLQGRVENKQVIMELYGKKDGRSSTISKPTAYDKIPAPQTKYVPTPTLPIGQTKCTEAPHDGVTTDVLYTVDYPDGTVKKKTFHSVYKPWQKVCLVGTALTTK